MSNIARTTVSETTVNTPILNANTANIGSLSLTNVDNIQAKEAYIENLTIKEINVLNPETPGITAVTEAFDRAIFNNVSLNFGDDYNCRYIIADENTLESKEEGKLLNITFDVPTEMGSKLVCRYIVLDLRNLLPSDNIGVVWNKADNLKWVNGAPDIEGGYLYILAFQRLMKSLIVGNVSLKLSV